MTEKSFWRPKVEDEVRDELAFHLEARTRDLIAQGIDPARARALALERMGDVTELERNLRTLGRDRDLTRHRREWFGELRQDIGLAFRSWRHNPWAALVVVGSLALGIGGAVATYGVVYAVLQKPLPFPREEQLVAVREEVPGSEQPFELGYPTFEDVARFRSFQRAGAYSTTELRFRDGEDTPEIDGAQVTGEFFSTLNASPALGRVLGPRDDTTAAQIVVVSDRFWRTRLGRRVDVVGTSISLDNQPYLVVGVMPPSFRFPEEASDFWIPFGLAQDWMRNRAVHIMSVIARLRDGARVGDAVREGAGAMNTIRTIDPGRDPGHEFAIDPLRTVVVGDARPVVLVLFAGVTTLLLLTAGNVSALVLSRTAAHRGEMAIRAALGAGRARLSRQVLTESVTLALLGGLGGIGCAYGAALWLARHLPNVPRLDQLGFNLPVLGFAAGATLLVGLLIGLAPVKLILPTEARTALGAAFRVTTGRTQRRMLQTVVVVQLGLTGALLVGSTAVGRSFLRVTRVDPGFKTANLLLATVSPPANGFNDARLSEYYRMLPSRLELIPGVTAATATSKPPLNGGDGYGNVTAEGQPFPPGGEPIASFRKVLPNYFRTLGIPLLAGREFTQEDRGGREMVVMVSRSMAEAIWPGASPLGRRIKVGPPETEPWLTVVGVVGDVRNIGLDAPLRFATYEPYDQRMDRTMTVAVRASADPASLTGPVRDALREPDRSIPVFRVSTMDQRVDSALAPRRFHVAVLGVFGAMALGLALLGVVGLTQFTANGRRREFGIRSALGASPASLVRNGLGETAALAAGGLALAVLGSFLTARTLDRLLVETKATEPVTMAAVVIGVTGAALAAAYWPFRRASRADPMAALREE